MKNRFSLLAVLLLIAVIFAVAAAIAGTVYDRTTATVTSTATWTNTVQYSAIQLERLWIYGSTVAADTVTVTRIAADSSSTQAVGSVTVATAAGNTATFTAKSLKYGDKLYFSSGAGSNSTAMIEYVVQQH